MNKQTKTDNPQVTGLDGFPRNKNLEEEISLNFTHLFSSPTGQAVLQYLRSVTIEAVHGSAVTNDTLRHAEGQRYIVGLIERRIQHGHKTRKG
tara:strand:- start:287 stop:565 length:279 start_codon:yes stop_codon:yes gene_type:complete